MDAKLAQLTNAALTNRIKEFNVHCFAFQIVKHLYMRCVSTGSRIFLFHVAYSLDATVEGRDITCKCHKVCNRRANFCVVIVAVIHFIHNICV